MGIKRASLNCSFIIYKQRWGEVHQDLGEHPCQKIVEQFMDSVQLQGIWGFRHWLVHNIIKKFRESEETLINSTSRASTLLNNHTSYGCSKSFYCSSILEYHENLNKHISQVFKINIYNNSFFTQPICHRQSVTPSSLF